MPNGHFRKARELQRARPTRGQYERILIVCEGSKTEPNYFEEIRKSARIPTASVRIMPSDLGTDPRSVVEYTESFLRSNPGFDRAYSVFDRDDHASFATAIGMANARDQRIRNDDRKLIRFEPVVSNPSFEFWLLLHFADVREWMHRDEVNRRLRGHIPKYEKGRADIFSLTQHGLADALQRASALKTNGHRLRDGEAYTDVHDLVQVLQNIRK